LEAGREIPACPLAGQLAENLFIGAKNIEFAANGKELLFKPPEQGLIFVPNVDFRQEERDSSRNMYQRVALRFPYLDMKGCVSLVDGKAEALGEES